MSETLRLVLTKFTDETITVFSSLLLITMALIVAYWFYNRKKFHQLSHEIPASVVKNYLDSIIQNSNSLKSSLFRGGGLEIGNGIPSVVPIGDLPSSSSIGIGSNSEEIHQKNAEIQSLSVKLNDRSKQIADLEKRINEISANGAPDADQLVKQISTLQTQLAEARASSGGDEALQRELASIRERLKEYEIIEEDLANLKRLQQENDQLKAELNSLRGGAATPAPATTAAEEPAEDLEAEMAKAIAESKQAPAEEPKAEEAAAGAPENEQKSAEELLQEFEKMLG